jgi:sterol desaturase/sphingolipid hydroxylase (fatty acid hydroxylase superfamily)
MRLSRAGYYADFYVYPTVMTVATAGALALTPPSEWALVGLAMVLGVAVWTFVEYQLHRWVLHHVPRIKDMHDAHHHDQMALIGTPTWLSALSIGLLVLLPTWLLLGLPLALGFTVGLTLGYFFYVTVHHGVHHWKVRPGSYFFGLKRRHALHHHFDDMGNFGVTSGFWDKVFGTDIKVKDGRRPRPEQA